jgi:hypothetical protein
MNLSTLAPITVKKKKDDETVPAVNLGSDSFIPKELASGVYGQAAANLSGSSFDSAEVGARRAFQKQAQNVQAQVSAANLGKMGQGDVEAVQAAGDQANRSAMTDLYLGIAQGKEQAKNLGVDQSLNIGNFEQQAGQAALQNAVNLGSAEGAQAAYANMTGMKIDPQSLRLALGDQKFSSIAGRIAAGATIEQINGEFGAGTLTQDQYDSMGKASQAGQFYAGLGSDEKKFYDNLDATMKLSYEQMSQQDRQYFSGLDADNQKFYAGLDSNERVAFAQMGSDEKKFFSQLNTTDRQFYAGLQSNEKVSFAKMNSDEQMFYKQLGQNDQQFYAGLGSNEKIAFKEMDQKDRQFFSGLAQESRIAFAQLDQGDRHFLRSMSLEESKYSETVRQFNIQTTEDRSRFDKTMTFNYDQLSQSDKQFLASIGLDQKKFEETQGQFKQTMAFSEKQFSETVRQFNITSAEDKARFDKTMKFSYDQLSQSDKQFLASIGLDREKFAETKSQFDKTMSFSEKQLGETQRQFNITTAEDKDRFSQTMKLSYDQLTQNDKQFLKSFGLDEKQFNETQRQFNKSFGLSEAQLNETMRQFNVTTADGKERFNRTMELDWAQLNQQDRQFFESIGFDKQKWADTNEQWKISRDDQLRMFSDNLDLERDKFNELKAQFDFTSSEGKRQFNEQMKLGYKELSQNDRQFMDSLGFDETKWEDTKKQWNLSYALEKQQVEASVGIEQAKMAILQDQNKREAYQFAGASLQEYMGEHLDATATDPALRGLINNYWAASGGTGAPPQKWVDSQVSSARDNRLTNPYDAALYTLMGSDMYKGMDAEQQKAVKAFAADALTGTSGLTMKTNADGTTSLVAVEAKPEELYTYDKFMSGEAPISLLAGAANQGSKFNPAYANLLQNTEEWTIQTKVASNGWWSPDVGKIKNAPAKDSIFKSGGVLYVATSGIQTETSGENYEYFTAKDVSTGITKTFKAKNK